jgi:hypothetical protein
LFFPGLDLEPPSTRKVLKGYGPQTNGDPSAQKILEVIDMFRHVVLVVASCAAIAGTVQAQTMQRRATFLGGGSPDRGKCTVEVVVDTAADVEIRGDTATLRTVAGQPAQWRRFECTGALPPNPSDFRFAGVDGRGRQVLARDPRNGGAAVIRIEDTQGGAEGYTFDIFWGAGYNSGPGPNGPGRIEPNRGGFDRNGDGRVDGRFDGPGRNDGPGYGRARRFSTEQAVQVCESSIRQQAERRFRTPNINFRGTALDDNPGRQDWVIGRIEVRRGYGRDEEYRFSCSVNFDNGNVRSAVIGERLRAGR